MFGSLLCLRLYNHKIFYNGMTATFAGVSVNSGGFWTKNYKAVDPTYHAGEVLNTQYPSMYGTGNSEAEAYAALAKQLYIKENGKIGLLPTDGTGDLGAVVTGVYIL